MRIMMGYIPFGEGEGGVEEEEEEGDVLTAMQKVVLSDQEGEGDDGNDSDDSQSRASISIQSSGRSLIILRFCLVYILLRR